MVPWETRSSSPDKILKSHQARHWLCFLLKQRWKTQHRGGSYYFSPDRKACRYQQQTQTKSLQTNQVSKEPYNYIPSLFLIHRNSWLLISKGHAGVSQADIKLVADAGLQTPTQATLLTSMLPIVPSERYQQRWISHHLPSQSKVAASYLMYKLWTFIMLDA